ncbi:MAG: DUF2061 domain-containing protein [Litorivicinus sp.]
MDRQRRSWMKAITWQILGLFTTVLIGYGFTGSWTSSATLSLALAGTSLVMYTLHERIWERIHWGRRTP